MHSSPCHTILTTTAALWFQHDPRRLAQFHRRRAAPPSIALAAAGPVMQPVSRGAVTAADLLPWRTDLTEQAQRELRELFRAQVAA